MNAVHSELNGIQVLEMQSEGIVVRNARDAADLAKQVLERGIKKLVLYEKNICPEMWQLSNGLAVAILKEFADAAVDVAFVGDFGRYKSKSFQALEAQTIFVDNVDLAKMRLTKH
ncbi:MAG: DUF4180 domain-containing protein [Spirochaetia bacterium]